MPPEQPKPSDDLNRISTRMGGIVFARWVGIVGAFGLLTVMSIGFLNGEAPWVLSVVFGILVLFFVTLAIDPRFAVDNVEKFLGALPKPGGEDKES